MRFLIAVLLILVAGCRAPAENAENLPRIRMATILGRVMTPLTAALNKVLPERFPARVEVQTIGRSGEYPELIESGRIEFAMVQTDFAYVAYTQGFGDSPQPMRKLRGVAVLYTTPLHLLARKSSGIRTVRDLRGKRVFVGLEGSPTEFTVKMSLQALGIAMTDIDVNRMPDTDFVSALRTGELDAVFYRGNNPSPTIKEMMGVPDVSFVSISRADIETIRGHHPFLRSASVPAGMYGNHSEIETVGGDMLFACRDDLPDELVYWVTRTLFETLPELADSLPALRQIDPEHVQASPIPLHAGALRFYRERELFP